MHSTLRALLILIVIGSAFAFAGTKFGWFEAGPGRGKRPTTRTAHDPGEEGPELVDSYPGLRYLTATQAAALDSPVLIDVRPAVEHEILRVTGARHLESPTKLDLQQAHAGRDGSVVAILGTDAASRAPFRVGLLAKQAELPEVYVVADGVFGWLEAHPEQCEFLGEPLDFARGHDLLVALRAHPDRCINASEVPRLIDGGFRVVDSRTSAQRIRVLLDLPHSRVQSVRDCVAELDTGAEVRPTLYVDAYGRQSRYLQLLLEERRDIEYAFLRGGAIGLARWNVGPAASPGR